MNEARNQGQKDGRSSFIASTPSRDSAAASPTKIDWALSQYQASLRERAVWGVGNSHNYVLHIHGLMSNSKPAAQQALSSYSTESVAAISFAYRAQFNRELRDDFGASDADTTFVSSVPSMDCLPPRSLICRRPVFAAGGLGRKYR